jgi:hypothetical protein
MPLKDELLAARSERIAQISPQIGFWRVKVDEVDAATDGEINHFFGFFGSFTYKTFTAERNCADLNIGVP